MLRTVTILAILLTIVGSSLFTISHVQAQIPSSQNIDIITIATNPETPVPGKPLTITLTSYNTDLQGADISWYSDTRLINKGTGMVTTQVTAPQSGGKVVITASIKTIEGVTFEKKLTLAPADVDLIWETDGLGPRFFKGRVPFTRQNNIKFVAIPNLRNAAGKIIPAQELLYTWKKDSTVLGSESGYGKNSITIPAQIVDRAFIMNVKVTGRGLPTTAEASLSLDASEQSILFYQTDPLYGTLYNKELGNDFTIPGQEAIITAIPFGFSATAINSTDLSYLWSINNVASNDLSKENSLTLRPRAGASGDSTISLEIRNAGRILQNAKDALIVYFNQPAERASSPLF